MLAGMTVHHHGEPSLLFYKVGFKRLPFSWAGMLRNVEIANALGSFRKLQIAEAIRSVCILGLSKQPRT